ncbi:MAG: hypothetical protein DRH43_06750 [Deltaproteobacteria bacterium]|nr:MAG: hypothetical protein DRH43_06750 [Deltaproteobacteria bacterium]
MKKDPRIYLAHILECADRIMNYLPEDERMFLEDPKTQDAVIRNFEIIGEAAKRIPEDYRQKYPDIPWRLMAGFRDVLIHCYEGVDLKQVWRIATRDLPPVRDAIADILPPLEQLEKELSDDVNQDNGD